MAVPIHNCCGLLSRSLCCRTDSGSSVCLSQGEVGADGAQGIPGSPGREGAAGPPVSTGHKKAALGKRTDIQGGPWGILDLCPPPATLPCGAKTGQGFGDLSLASKVLGNTESLSTLEPRLREAGPGSVYNDSFSVSAGAKRRERDSGRKGECL